MKEEEIIEIVKDYIQYKETDGNIQSKTIGLIDEAIQGLLDLYEKEKEKNKKMYKQLQDIHDNFLKFNWQESNPKQIHNQLADLYESIYRRNN